MEYENWLGSSSHVSESIPVSVSVEEEEEEENSEHKNRIKLFTD